MLLTLKHSEVRCIEDLNAVPFYYILKQREKETGKRSESLCECVYETHLRGKGRSLNWPLNYHVFGVNREGCAAACHENVMKMTAFSDIPPCRKLPCATGL